MDRDVLPEPLPSGYRVQDRYVIQADLSQTRMARVYKALDARFTEVVAMHVLSIDQRTTDGIRRFRDWFRRARQAHPDQVQDYGEWLGVPFVVAAYVEGQAPIELLE